MLSRTAYRCATVSADVVVIGAGVVGAAVALHLRRNEVAKSVTVVDPQRGPGQGSTSYSSGCIRTFYSVEDMVRTSQEALHLWRNWGDYVRLPVGRQLPQFRECGSAILYTPNSKEFLDGFIACAARNRVPTERWDRQTTQERLGTPLQWDVDTVYSPRRIDDERFDEPVPGAKADGSVFVPGSGYIADPRLATQNIAEAATAAGAQFHYGASVVEITKSAERRVSGVRLSDGMEVSAPVVVNCSGPFSSFIDRLAFEGGAQADASGNPGNDSRVPTRPLRAEVAFVPPPPGVDMDRDGVVGCDFDVGIYFRPEPGNRLLIGSIDPPCDPHVYVDDADELSKLSEQTFGDMWTHCVMRGALRMPNLPIPSARAAQGIVAPYDVTPDWSPVLDRSSLPGYYFATGTSGNAFKNAPIIGDAMSRLIEYVEGGGDHDNAPLSVHLSHTDCQFELASTSRLRKQHQTTGTVIG